MDFSYANLAEIEDKLGPAMKNDNIAQWDLDNCRIGVPGANFLSNAFLNMKSLQALSFSFDEDDDQNVDDDIMAGCISSLAACTGMQTLKLRNLELSTNSCAALSTVFPRMAALLELDLGENAINDSCVEVLVRGLAECRHLQSLDLSCNRVSDDGLEVLIQGLPASVDTLTLKGNEITLSRQLSLSRFKNLFFHSISLSPRGLQVIAASLANPECLLKGLILMNVDIWDEGAAILAESLRNNRRLKYLDLSTHYITETGWNSFRTVLCDTASINATHGSNHTLRYLGYDFYDNTPQDIKMLLELNSAQDKSHVAAKKILQAHHHLDMKPLFNRRLDLLPHVVAWLERFAGSRLDHKLSSIYEFVRAMPQEAVDGVAGKKKGKKRGRDNA